MHFKKGQPLVCLGISRTSFYVNFEVATEDDVTIDGSMELSQDSVTKSRA